MLSNAHHHHHRTLDHASWSSLSDNSSPPPPPPPPVPMQVAARWARAENDNCGPCPQCRGRLVSLPTRTTSLSSYSGCKEKVVPVPRPTDDDESFSVICDRELHSLHRNVPALKRKDVDTQTIKQHFYPEGGWGWLVCGAGFLAHLLTSGLQLAFGMLYLYTTRFLGKTTKNEVSAYSVPTACLGALSLCTSLFIAPVVVATCRRKSTRLAAALGGLLTALSCLFTSFAVQFHQSFFSYGLLLGLGAGMVRETSGLMLGHYFKRKRQFVEMVVQTGTGVGVALFSVLYKEAVGKLGWRLGLQAVTGLMALAFFLPLVYRSANLYHPQRSAIMHLKNQRKKVTEKKGRGRKKKSYFDFSPLRSHALRVLMGSGASAALGIYAPIFYLVYQGTREGLEESVLVVLQTFIGFAYVVGCTGSGLILGTRCLIPRQYLCQAANLGIGVSLLILAVVKGYHGYVVFSWLYGISLGGYLYSLKMLALEQIKGRHFTKSWSFIQGATSVPILVGIPVTGYLNEYYPKSGYYFSFVTTVIGATLLFLMGHPKDQVNCNKNLQTHRIPNFNECICTLPLNYVTCVPEVHPFGFFKPSTSYCDNFLSHNGDFYRGSCGTLPPKPVPKSLSCAANIDRSPINYPMKYCDYLKMTKLSNREILRLSKSVPEGLARLEYRSPYYRRPIRNVQVIEQITTSV